MKFSSLLVVLVISSIAFNLHAQNKVESLDYYEASNGITYKKGDRIKLRYGSADHNNFRSISHVKGFVSGYEKYHVSAVYADFITNIKSIKRYNTKKGKGVIFHIDGMIYGTSMNIEMAIEHCEIYDCDGKTKNFVFDESAKSRESFEKRMKYTASNGVTYKVGDEITLNGGSAKNGDFVFLTDAKDGVMVFGEHQRSKGKRMGETVVIKKITKYNLKHLHNVYFTVNVAGRLINSILDIEGALYSCEVGDCAKKKVIAIKEKEIIKQESVAPPPARDKYELLREVKKLYDEGVLTEAEYAAEKKRFWKKSSSPASRGFAYA